MTTHHQISKPTILMVTLINDFGRVEVGNYKQVSTNLSAAIWKLLILRKVAASLRAPKSFWGKQKPAKPHGYKYIETDDQVSQPLWTLIYIFV